MFINYMPGAKCYWQFDGSKSHRSQEIETLQVCYIHLACRAALPSGVPFLLQETSRLLPFSVRHLLHRS